MESREEIFATTLRVRFDPRVPQYPPRTGVGAASATPSADYTAQARQYFSPPYLPPT